MRKLLLAVLFAPMTVFAAGAELKLDRAPDRTHDMAALQNGAKLFVNYCLNCHSASYMRYNRLKDIGLTDEQIKDKLLFTADKVGEPMKIAMQAADARQWFGAAPPDLTVIARSRASEFGSGADWLYSYLRGFYRDDTRPTGWNNTVFENVGMPHPLWQLQGWQEKRVDANGAVRLQVVEPGSMSGPEYDRAIRDLVTFLSYIAEPMQLDRQRIGIYAMLFLLVFLVLAYLLKKEYWKDVH